jgi:GNAT superfamily N-acetyltransferase
MHAPRIEPATAADIPALTRLRAEQGWHPSPRLLRTIHAWEGGRIFLIRQSTLADPGPLSSLAGQSPIATTSAIAAGTVGVIGNVIVRAEYRNRGLGRVIMEATLRWLRERGVRHVVLAATPEGRPLYARLGFVDMAPSWFAQGPVAPLDYELLVTRAGATQARQMPVSSLAALAALDRAAFGGDRLGLLDVLLCESQTWLYVAGDHHGEPSGYLIVRRLQSHPDTLQIGPWVAQTPEAAAALLAAALGPQAAWHERMDPDIEPRILAVVDRRNALALLGAAGATLIEDDIVMQLDFAPGSPPESIAATAGPPQPIATHPDWLYAWLAPMVF